MSQRGLRVLLVEDSESDALLILRALRGTGSKLEHTRVENADSMRAALQREAFDLVLSDWSIPSFDALGALAILKETGLDIPFIVVSGTIGETAAVDAMRSGAKDYVFKDRLARLVPAVERELIECKVRSRQRVVEVALAHAETANRAVQARFRALVENSADGFALSRADGTFFYVSPAAARILGRKAEEIVGTHFRDYIHPDDLAIALSQQQRLLEEGQSSTTVRRILRPDGAVRWVEVSSTSFLDDGATGGVVGNIRDITDRRVAEEALVVAERRFTALFESGIIGIIITSESGEIRAANDTFLAMLGYTRDDLNAGRLDWRKSTPAEWDAWNRVAGEELRRLGSSKPREKEYLRSDGSRVCALVGLAKVDGPNVISVSVDLTEQKKADAATRSEQARFRALVENSADGITLNTRDGSFAYVSPAAERIFGASADELIGRAMIDFIHPEDRSESADAIRSVGDDAGARQTTASRVVRADGSVRWVETTRTNRLDDPAVAGVVGNVRDTTDRKLAEDALAVSKSANATLEAQLRHAQKMEAVGRLAGGVAHDFNNVLSVIMSYGDFLLERCDADSAMREDVEEIRKAAKRAAGLTRQLLMFSRQQVIEPRVVDLNEAIAGMDKMLQRILGEDVELVTLAAKKLGNVLVDPTAIEQVVMNLVVNARDAMPTGGQLTMETANVVLDDEYARLHIGTKPGDYVMFAVTDTGTGMEKETLAQIFEPFFTTKEIGKGTGLGLSTVFGIVKQSGGSVWVYSELGVGTTFKIYLPRVETKAAASETVAPPKSLSGSETILLVEDEDQVRQIARTILTRSGYEVIEARNAGEATVICEKHAGAIHLLLSDVVMPKVSGPVLAKRLAQLRPAMKVLCMSGYTDDAIVRHGVMDAQFAFLQKPFTAETLTRKVREVLDSPFGA